MCQVLVHKVEKERYLYYSLKKKSSHYNIVCSGPSKVYTGGVGVGICKKSSLDNKGWILQLLFHRSHHTQHLTLWGQLRPKCSRKAFTLSLIALEVIMREPAQFCLL